MKFIQKLQLSFVFASLWVHLVVISSFFPLPEFFINFFRRSTEKLHLMPRLPVFVHQKLRYNYILLLQWCLNTNRICFFFSLVIFLSLLRFAQNLILNIRFGVSEKKTTKYSLHGFARFLFSAIEQLYLIFLLFTCLRNDTTKCTCTNKASSIQGRCLTMLCATYL